MVNAVGMFITRDDSGRRFFFSFVVTNWQFFLKFSGCQGTTWPLCLFRVEHVEVCEVDIKSFRRYIAINLLQNLLLPQDFTKNMFRTVAPNLPFYYFPTCPFSFFNFTKVSTVFQIFENISLSDQEPMMGSCLSSLSRILGPTFSRPMILSIVARHQWQCENPFSCFKT